MSTRDAEAIGLRPEAIERWLCDVDRDAQPPLRFDRLGNGKSNVTVLAEDARGHRWVLRRPPFGHVAPSAHDIVREQSIVARLFGTRVPVPRVLAMTRDPTVSEVPLVLLEYVDGVVLDTNAAVMAVPIGRRHELGLSVARTLARIHAVDLGSAGLADLASHKPYAARQLRRWLRQWEASRTRTCPLVDRAAATLLAQAPDEPEVSLLHGDYHLRNVILDRGFGEVRAVVDWELATLGDPLADLGVLLAYWPRSRDDPIAALAGMAPLPAGFPSDEQLIDAYAGASGRAVERVRYWQALGYWKIAIIGEGVRRRAIDDPRNGEPLPAQAIDAVIERARELLARRGV